MICSTIRFMGFPAMDPLIGLAERTEPCFDILDKAEGNPLLAAPGVPADRAAFTQPGHGPVCRSDRFHDTSALPTLNACPRNSPTP